MYMRGKKNGDFIKKVAASSAGVKMRDVQSTGLGFVMLKIRIYVEA